MRPRLLGDKGQKWTGMAGTIFTLPCSTTTVGVLPYFRLLPLTPADLAVLMTKEETRVGGIVKRHVVSRVC